MKWKLTKHYYYANINIMSNEFDPHVSQDRKYEQNQSSFSSDMELLFEETGFRTPEIEEATFAIIKGYNLQDVDDSIMRQAWIELANITENSIDQAEDGMRAKLQVAAIINKALILLLAQKPYRYLEELDTAEVLARNSGLDDLSETIDREINRRLDLESHEMNPEVLVVRLRGIVSEINREFMRDLIANGDDMEDIITHAYNAILEEGGDPEDVLSELGILED